MNNLQSMKHFINLNLEVLFDQNNFTRPELFWLLNGFVHKWGDVVFVVFLAQWYDYQDLFRENFNLKSSLFTHSLSSET